MTNKPVRFAQAGAHQLLRRVLEEPDLVSVVQALEPRTLGRLIRHVGLEDAGELVALATTEQLEKIFDEDLWHSAQPGQDETFDADRFALWLEVMLESGDAFTARKLTELPEDLVTLALQRQILVIDMDQLVSEMGGGEDDERVEKALDGCLCEELDQYRVISRRHEGWDAILAVLLALDERHHDFLVRLLERCCAASAEQIEESGGLYQVLTSAEMLESDASAEREDRRARAGFVAPSAAASFLGLARTTPLDEIMRAEACDPLTRAYFRHYVPEPAATTATVTAAASAPPAGAARMLELLQGTEVRQEARPARLLDSGAAEHAAEAEGSFKRAIAELQERDPALYAQRTRELGYLANVVSAGCSVAGGRFRPFEAVEAAVAVCNLGLEQMASASGQPIAAIVRQHSADKLFRVGWHRLHQDATLPPEKALERLLARR